MISYFIKKLHFYEKISYMIIVTTSSLKTDPFVKKKKICKRLMNENKISYLTENGKIRYQRILSGTITNKFLFLF